MKSVFESPNPAREQEHASIEAQTAAFIRAGGSIQHLPPAAFAREHQPFSVIEGGKARSNRQEWKEGIV